MTVNTRIRSGGDREVATVRHPDGVDTPDVQAAVLVDGAGNIIAASDNGDGTASLSVAPGATATTVKVALTGSNQAVSTAPIHFRGLIVSETSATTSAKVEVYDNDDAATGTCLPYTLAASESRSEYYPEGGIPMAVGIYIKATGAFQGVVLTGPAEE